MKVVTIGSKIYDEAIYRTASKIINKRRITNFSPFVLYNNKQNQFIYEDKELRCENSYLCDMLRAEITADLKLGSDYSYAILDLLDCRCSFNEYVFADGTKLRVSCENGKGEYIQNLLNYKQKKGAVIVSTKRYNPFEFSDEELEEEMQQFCTYISQYIDKDKMILIGNHNVTDYLDINGSWKKMNNYISLQKYNYFYDQCFEIFQRYIQCKIIPAPKILYSNEKEYELDFFVQSNLYYCYIIDATIGDVKKAYDEYHIAVKKFIYDMYDKSYLAKRFKQSRDKKFILLGDCIYNEWFKQDYGIQIYNNTEIDALEELEEDSNGIFVIPLLNNMNNIYRVIEKYGENNVICCLHKPILLKKFTGTYEDFYNNKIKSDTPIDITIYGSNNIVNIGKNLDGSYYRLLVQNNNRIIIEDNVHTNLDKPISIYATNNSHISVGKNTSFVVNNKIECTNGGKICIGKDCLLSSEIVMRNDNRYSKEIYIGDHVWIGYRVYVLNGATINTGAILGARTVVENMDIPNNCCVVGQPAKIIKKNVVWHRHLWAESITEIDEKYRKFTE